MKGRMEASRSAKRISRNLANGAVCAAGPEATEAGLSVLSRGGGAADAAAAALLTMCVTHVGAVCVGGEVAAMVYNASNRTVSTLNGVGCAPRDPQAIDVLFRRDIDRTGIAMASVPGVVDFVVTLLRDYGAWKFEEVVAPALSLLHGGRSPDYFDTALRRRLNAVTGEDAERKSDDLARDNPGQPWFQRLAGTFERLIRAERRGRGSRGDRLEAVRTCFYRDEVGDQLARWYDDQGALLSKADLETFRTRREEPVAIGYHAWTVMKCGSWTQGPWLCQALRLLESLPGFTCTRGDIDSYHVLIEAMKLARSDRDAYFGDPAFVDVPLNQLLGDDYVAVRRQSIHPGRAMSDPLPGDPLKTGTPVERRQTTHSSSIGTVSLVVRDRAGNLVTATASGVGSTAGCGGETGVIHGTRLNDFDMCAGHPNAPASGKRPSVTLSPTVVLENGVPCLATSVPGGDLQDQVSLQAVLSLERNGATDFSVSAPVLIVDGDRKPRILVHETLGKTLRDSLSRLGHPTARTRLDFVELGGSYMAEDSRSGMVALVGPAVDAR